MMPSSRDSPFESLPNELLDEIVSFLSTPPPSLSRLHEPPNINITQSTTRDLKNLSRTCSRFLDLLRPQLFSHSCFDLKDVNEYISFISRLDLGSYVTSIVVKGRDTLDTSRNDQLWWRRVLSYLDPIRITVIAPPTFIGAMLGTQIVDEHSWAFEIPFQILQLECDQHSCDHKLSSLINKPPSLLNARTWKSLLYNESSSLKAYHHYEYFLFQTPSVFNRWSTLVSSESQPEISELSLFLESLTTFTYVAVFPFYNHVNLVQDSVAMMPNLQFLNIRLGPSKNDRVTELEQRGSMDTGDPWMEFATGYSLIAYCVRGLGNKGLLKRFTACDYEFESLQPELNGALVDMLDDGGWAHDGHGTWTKEPARTPDVGGNPTMVI